VIFLVCCEYGSDSMGFDLWGLKTVFGWNLMDVEIFCRICGDCFWDFDLWRLFAGVVLM
jgi:hypothetical protein